MVAQHVLVGADTPGKERALLTAQQCAWLLESGHEYTVIKVAAPGSWLTDISSAALDELNRAEERRLKQNGGSHGRSGGTLEPLGGRRCLS